MTALLTKAAAIKAARTVRKAWCAVAFAFFAAAFVANPPQAVAAGACVMDSTSKTYVDGAIANNPALAGNPEAQAAYMAIIGQESGYNTQAVGKYLDKEGHLVSASYGLGQVNYYAHQAAINDLVRAGTGSDISTLPYDERKAIGGQWLLDNPQAATNLSAQIFSDLLASSGGDISRAVYNYNGGSDPQYLAHVQNKLDNLKACGIVPGTTAVVLSTESVVSDPASENVIVCPDLELAEALEKANEYYVAQVVRTTRTASDLAIQKGLEATETDADGNVSPASGFLGKIENQYCFTRYKNWIDGVRTLISAFDLLHMISALLTALWDQLTAFVCDAVVTVANNILESICIPLPNLNMSYDAKYKSLDHKYCDGLSAADFMSFRQKGMTFNDVVYGTTGMRFEPWSATKQLEPVLRRLE